MEFLQSLLSKVPIHVLPMWYAISRTSDSIIGSIIEKYLGTPKIYEKYLQEINFDDPILKKISKDVFSAPNFTIEASQLRKKHRLSHENFEKYMLLLEYHLVCCLSYQPVKGGWQEVVTPFHEWKEYLCFLRDTEPEPIKEIDKIETLDFDKDSIPISERDLREIKRSLKRVSHLGWIYLEDFLRGFTAAICETEPVALKSKGKRWKYAIPTYSQDEINLVQNILFGRLHSAGIVEIGTHRKKPCFCVTSYGRLSIE